jgi:hypothetical protein
MHFRFKSLLILSEREQRVAGGTKSTTLYDLHNIGEHTFDAPSWRLRLHPIHLLATPLIASPVLGLALYIATAFTDGAVWSMPLVVLGLIAAPLALFYPLSMHGLLNRMMESQARRERLLADSIKITVVPESDWESFRAKLKEPDAVDKVSLLVAQLARRQRGEEQRVPLPDENALQKWEGQASEGENPPKENDKVTERPGVVKPESSNPNTSKQGESAAVTDQPPK